MLSSPQYSCSAAQTHVYVHTVVQTASGAAPDIQLHGYKYYDYKL